MRDRTEAHQRVTHLGGLREITGLAVSSQPRSEGIALKQRSLLSGLAIGMGLAVWLATMTGAANDGPRSGSDLYSRLQAAAGEGDPRAVAELVAVDSFMAQRNLSPADLGVPALEVERTAAQSGLVRLSLKDQAPWRITVYNETAFTDAASISAYAAARHAALGLLADADPNRIIDAILSPNTEVSVTAFAQSLSCPCESVHLTVDVYGPGGWMMAAGREIIGRDFAAQSRAIESEILDQAAFSLDQFPGVRRADLRANVRAVQLRMTADAALASSRSESVLVVDPLSDIADAYAGRAAVVEVANAPELWQEFARIVLNRPLGVNGVAPAAPEGEE